MSAVVGVYHPDGRPVERTDLERMVEALAHRGPDGAGMWNKGPIGLVTGCSGRRPSPSKRDSR